MASHESHERVAQVACEAFARGERIREVVARVFNTSETAAAKRITLARKAGFAIPLDHTGRHRAPGYSWSMFMADLRVAERTFDLAEWRHEAACRNEPVELFYPPHGTSHAQINAARAVCERCTVREDCLNYALDNHERFGIWGGLSERQRRRIRRETRTSVIRYLAGD